jgi:hypothetical protein
MNIYKGMFLKPFILVVWKPKAINATHWMQLAIGNFAFFAI